MPNKCGLKEAHKNSISLLHLSSRPKKTGIRSSCTILDDHKHFQGAVKKQKCLQFSNSVLTGWKGAALASFQYGGGKRHATINDGRCPPPANSAAAQQHRRTTAI